MDKLASILFSGSISRELDSDEISQLDKDLSHELREQLSNEVDDNLRIDSSIDVYSKKGESVFNGEISISQYLAKQTNIQSSIEYIVAKSKAIFLRCILKIFSSYLVQFDYTDLTFHVDKVIIFDGKSAPQSDYFACEYKKSIALKTAVISSVFATILFTGIGVSLYSNYDRSSDNQILIEKIVRNNKIEASSSKDESTIADSIRNDNSPNTSSCKCINPSKTPSLKICQISADCDEVSIAACETMFREYKCTSYSN